MISKFKLNPEGNPYFSKLDKSLTKKIIFKSYPINSLKSFKSIIAILKIYLSIIVFRPSVVISYHEKSDLINLFLSLFPFSRHRTVSSKRDMGLKLEGAVGSVIKRYNYRFSAITAPSHSIIEMMIEHFNSIKEKSYTIPNGVDLSCYGKKVKDSVQVKKRLGLPLNKTLMISVGWLREGKGHEYVIRALSALDKKDGYAFVVLGEGPDRERLSQLAEELGVKDCVYLMGMQNNVSDWLSVSDVAISASFSEGLSNALVEAAASQLPIIATNVGGNPEVVEDGYNGILVDPRSHTSLKQAIESICSEDETILRMGKNSRLKAEKEFSISSMVDSLESLYKNLSGVKNVKP